MQRVAGGPTFHAEYLLAAIRSLAPLQILKQTYGGFLASRTLASASKDNAHGLPSAPARGRSQGCAQSRHADRLVDARSLALQSSPLPAAPNLSHLSEQCVFANQHSFPKATASVVIIIYPY